MDKTPQSRGYAMYSPAISHTDSSKSIQYSALIQNLSVEARYKQTQLPTVKTSFPPSASIPTGLAPRVLCYPPPSGILQLRSSAGTRGLGILSPALASNPTVPSCRSSPHPQGSAKYSWRICRHAENGVFPWHFSRRVSRRAQVSDNILGRMVGESMASPWLA